MGDNTENQSLNFKELIMFYFHTGSYLEFPSKVLSRLSGVAMKVLANCFLISLNNENQDSSSSTVEEIDCQQDQLTSQGTKIMSDDEFMDLLPANGHLH